MFKSYNDDESALSTRPHKYTMWYLRTYDFFFLHKFSSRISSRISLGGIQGK